MNWLITGGCGFIGAALTKKLLEKKDINVRVFDDLSVGSLDDLKEATGCEPIVCVGGGNWSNQIEFYKGDILDAKALTGAVKGADVIVHLAANTGVGPSVLDPHLDCKVNVEGTLNVLESAREAGVKRVVFASSGAPLGAQIPPLNEKMAPRPASPYGASKLAGEGYCSAYFQCFSIDTVVLRFGNVYGPGSKNKESVVAKFIKLAINGEAINIYGDGSQTRDFIFIDDLIQAVLLAGKVPNTGGEVFQIATATETSVVEMLQSLFEVMEQKGVQLPKQSNVSLPSGDVTRNYSDTSKAKAVLSWEARVSLKEGLGKTLDYFLSNNKR